MATFNDKKGLRTVKIKVATETSDFVKFSKCV